MRALLIEWEPSGRRAGNINNKDKNLECRGWQNMDVVPMLELRLVNDDRDLSFVDDVDGVTLIEGQDNINDAINTYFPDTYHINDVFLYQEHFKQKNKKNETMIDIDKLPNDYQERLKVLKDIHGMKGIRKKERNRV